MEFQDTMVDKKTGKTATDLAQPSYHLFEKHSSGRQCRSINTTIMRHINSFPPPRSTVIPPSRSSRLFHRERRAPLPSPPHAALPSQEAPVLLLPPLTKVAIFLKSSKGSN